MDAESDDDMHEEMNCDSCCVFIAKAHGLHILIAVATKPPLCDAK